MLHEQIDPKAVIARVASENRLAAKANAHRAKFNPKILGDSARGRLVTLMLHDGRILDGVLKLGTSERVALLEAGKSSVTWIDIRDVSDVDF